MAGEGLCSPAHDVRSLGGMETMAPVVGEASRAASHRKCTRAISIRQIENIGMIHRKKRTVLALRTLYSLAPTRLSWLWAGP